MKAARGGLLPVDWFVRVQASGLEHAKSQQFQGVTPVEKIEDPELLKKGATEIRVMEEDLFNAMIAIQTAVNIRAAHMVVFAISEKEGTLVDIVIEKVDNEGKKTQQNQRVVGPSHMIAFIEAGKQVHKQLLLLHQNTGKLKSYVERIAAIDRFRRAGDKRIITPGQN